MAEIRFRIRGPDLVETATATPDQRCVVNLHFSNFSRARVKFQHPQLGRPDTCIVVSLVLTFN